jgi:ribose transport system substrate-binding protein
VKKLSLIAVAGCVLAFALAACGGSSSSSTSSSSTGSSSESTSSSEPAASTSGSTGSTPLPGGTIGVVELTAESEIIADWGNTIETALKEVGWNTVIIDGKGDPAVIGQGMTSLVSQHVDGIITLIVDAPLIAPQLKAAKAAGIPVIASGTEAADPEHLFSATYAPSDKQFGVVMGEYLVEHFSSGTEYTQFSIPAALPARLFYEGLEPLLAKGGFKLAATKDIAPSDLVNATTKATADLAAGYPNASLLVSCCDFTPPIMIPTLAQEGASDVTVTGKEENLSTLALIREGAPVVAVAANADTGPLIAVGALLAHTASETPIPDKNDQSKYEFAVIDNENVPQGSEELYFEPSEQIAAFVKEWSGIYKW